MHPLNPNNPIYIQVLRDFKRWSKDQTFIRRQGMVGQTEVHFPCKAAYAVAVFDHDKEKFAFVRVMTKYGEWSVIEL